MAQIAGKIGLKIGEAVLTKLVDKAFDKVWGELFGYPENPIDYLKKNQETLDKIVGQLKDLDRQIQQLSVKLDEKFLDLKGELARQDVTWIEGEYIAYMTALKGVDVKDPRTRSTLTTTGTRIANGIWQRVYAIHSSLTNANGRMPLILEAAISAKIRYDDLIVCYVALSSFYEPYLAAQIKALFLMRALYRDQTVDFSTGKQHAEDLQGYVQTQMAYFSGPDCLGYRWKLADRIVSNPGKDVPFRFTSTAGEYDKKTGQPRPVSLKSFGDTLSHLPQPANMWIPEVPLGSDIFYLEPVDIRSDADVLKLDTTYNFRFRHESGRYLVCEGDDWKPPQQGLPGFMIKRSNAVILSSDQRRGTWTIGDQVGFYWQSTFDKGTNGWYLMYPYWGRGGDNVNNPNRQSHPIPMLWDPKTEIGKKLLGIPMTQTEIQIIE